MPSFFAVAGGLIALYYSSFIFRFVQNYVKGRKIGLPMITVPWDQNHYVWMAVSVPLRPFLQKVLPKALFDRLTLSIYGWEFHEKLRPFAQYAQPQGNEKTFFLLTCGTPEINTSDPEFAWQILSRPRDFQQPGLNSLFMAKFGHNVLTTNGERWARQRKVIASVINERISKAVFRESTRHTGGLLGELYERADGVFSETNQLFAMMKKITILVLSGAGMGASVNWKDDENEKPRDGHRMNYMDACKTVIDAVAGPIVLPRWFLFSYPSFLPGQGFLKRLGYAIEEFPLHTQEMLEQERERAASQGGDAKSNIMSQLSQATAGDGKSSRTLSDEEMVGNLFIFTAAGFDTTANTLSYALVLFCRYPGWQDWVFEEIDSVLPPDASEDLDYVTVFPKIVRIMAVMLETLRLFTPVIHLAKETKTAQVVQTSKGTYNIPAGCLTYVDAIALHLDPAVWRDLNKATADSANIPPAISGSQQADESLFRPTRWISPPGSQHPLFQPPRGSYLPWSGGPRVCPGQKMAQVEFSAIFITLFRQHRIEAVPLTVQGRDETKQEMNARLDALMANSVSILTLQMQGVYEAKEGVDDGKGLKIRLCRR